MSCCFISTDTISEDAIISPDDIIVDIRDGDTQIDLKILVRDTPRIAGGYEFVYQEKTRYSGFQVRKDPANSLVWIASTLFIIGTCGTLYFPYRQVWILLESDSPSTKGMLIRTRSRLGFSTKPELDIITDEIKTRLPDLH